MGDYYKLKKILLILFIIFTILRIINTSRVFASEAVEVTPTWNDGTITTQADNNFLSLQENQKNIQIALITQMYRLYRLDSARADVISTCNAICVFLTNSHASYGGVPTGIIFGEDSSGNYYFEFASGPCFNNIVYRDAYLNNGYKLQNVPFYSYNRGTGGSFIQTINKLTGKYTRSSTGSTYISCAEFGVYVPEWVDLFKYVGVITDIAQYQDTLESIDTYTQNSYQQLQNQTYLQNQTNNTITNTYNYLNNENVEEITSLGFSSPDVEEKIDLNDVFDQFEELLTDENYHSKQFSIWLPNGAETMFSLSPTLLEDNLTRIGGTYIIQIIHAIWFISLYGWYIFAYFGILGKLISGDWFHLVRGQSPVTRMVKFSVGSIIGNVRF